MRWIRRIKLELAYYRALSRHPGTPRLARGLIVLALLYLVSPIDLIPDGIPVLGQLDDLLIVPGLIGLAVALIPATVKRECRATAVPPMATGEDAVC